MERQSFRLKPLAHLSDGRARIRTWRIHRGRVAISVYTTVRQARCIRGGESCKLGHTFVYLAEPDEAPQNRDTQCVRAQKRTRRRVFDRKAFMKPSHSKCYLSGLAFFAAALLCPVANAHSSVTDAGFTEVSFAQSGWIQASDLVRPAPDGLLVDLRDDLDEDEIDALERETGLDLVATSNAVDGNRFVLRGTDLKRAMQVLSGRDEIESVEENVFYALYHPGHIDGATPADEDDDEDEEAPESARPPTTRPDDPMYKHQWHFDMVNAEGAWSMSSGEGVVVAVIDTGVSPGKLANGQSSRYRRVPDLKDAVLVPGYNFVDNNADPSDGNGHGTHVAGTIAQTTHNAFGVAGLAYKAKIMPIKVLSDRGFGSVGAISNGIRFAADQGAKIINMSLGGGMYSATLARAVKYARDKGVVVVCAAGNGGREKVEYPAAYKGAFAVSALGPDGKLAFYSSYGKETDIAAPGGDTRVDLNGDGIPDGVLQDTIARGDPTRHGFFPFQGTSMATPHVAAGAALVASLGVSDPDEIESILQSTAHDLGDAIRYGAGGMDVAAAVRKAHREKSLLGLGLAAGLALLGLRRRRDAFSTHLKPGLGFWTSLVFGASGFFVLRDLGLVDGAGIAYLASPIGEWPALLLGVDWHLSPIIGSVLLAALPVLFLYGVKSMRGILAGFAFGVAGFLFARAGLGSVDVQWIPGHGLLDFAWLAFQGFLSAGLALLLLKRD